MSSIELYICCLYHYTMNCCVINYNLQLRYSFVIPREFIMKLHSGAAAG